jgi:hypothetical protein
MGTGSGDPIWAGPIWAGPIWAGQIWEGASSDRCRRRLGVMT